MSWIEDTVECLKIKEVVQTCIEMAQYTQLAAVDPKLNPFVLSKTAELYKLLLYHHEMFLKYMSDEVSSKKMCGLAVPCLEFLSLVLHS